jgi:hypothetical protein
MNFSTAKKVFVALTHDFIKKFWFFVIGVQRHLFAVNTGIDFIVSTRVRVRLPDTGQPDVRTICGS